MISLHRSKVLGVIALIGALAGVAGCGAETGATASDATGDVAQAQGKDVAAHGRRGHRPPGGPEGLLFASLHELDLTDAQRTTIQGAIDKLEAGRRGPSEQDKAAFATLASGVRAGKIDSAAVLARANEGDRGEAHRAAAAEAIQTLHATLTKDQRRALVDKMEKRMAEHGAKGEREAKDRGPGAEHERGRMMGPVGFMLHGIDLSDAQRQKIHEALEARKPAEADRDAMKKRFESMRAGMRAKAESFVGDSFDPKAFVAPPEGMDAMGPKQHLQRVIDDVSAILPILEPAQREALAANLEKGPTMGPRGGRPGMGGHGAKGAPDR